VFRDAEEDALENYEYLKKTSNIYHGLSARKVRNFAFEYVVVLYKKKIPDVAEIRK
jgi:hypothetical protein